jgi:hypothetical protein
MKDACDCHLITLAKRFYPSGSREDRAIWMKAADIDAMGDGINALLAHMMFEEMYFAPMLLSANVLQRLLHDHRSIRTQIRKFGAPIKEYLARHGEWENEQLIPFILYDSTTTSPRA